MKISTAVVALFLELALAVVGGTSQAEACCALLFISIVVVSSWVYKLTESR